jgi:iron complex transport system ATP-binding protein
LSKTRHIINYHVHKNYNNPDPKSDLFAYALAYHIDGPFVGLMTAAYVEHSRTATFKQDGMMVSTVITAGLSNAFSAGRNQPGLSAPGTINTILFIDGNLTTAALVNVVINATEAKTDMLREHAIRSPDGHYATGTSTDAIVVACTGSGELIPYAGPATLCGWLVARSIRQALGEALS